MLGSLLVTIVLFMLAVFLCVTLNFVFIRRTWEYVPEWVRRTTFICCVGVIFSILYLLVSHLWGAM
jgi:hypothetical protein